MLNYAKISQIVKLKGSKLPKILWIAKNVKIYTNCQNAFYCKKSPKNFLNEDKNLQKKGKQTSSKCLKIH